MDIRWVIGAVLIAIGVPLFYLAGYFLAPEDRKRQKARSLKWIAIAWMAAGVVIYLIVLLTQHVA